MPQCAACLEAKGFNRFHAEQRRARLPVCKECVRAGRRAVAADAGGGGGEDSTAVTASQPQGARLEDFQLLSMIGQGAFGKVLLVRHAASREVFAMKIISKRFLIESDSVRHMRAERDIMTKVAHPFVTKLSYAFQNDSKVYLVMDFQTGGELFSYLRNEGTFTEDTARFYLAEMVLALEHLHSKGIIHRDLKPENVLISGEGHIKLTDFGVARQFQEGDALKTVCGTKEYMAPEMLLGKGYDAAVDWWSLGALAYEMLVGKPPFHAKNGNGVQQKILTAKVVLPKWLSADAHSLLRSLLERNVSKRLGGGKSSMFVVRGVQALKSHQFFKKIDWAALEKLEVAPPMVPKVSHEADTSNFDVKFTKMPASDLACDAISRESDEQFSGFSFYGLESLVSESIATSLQRRKSSLVVSNMAAIVEAAG